MRPTIEHKSSNERLSRRQEGALPERLVAVLAHPHVRDNKRDEKPERIAVDLVEGGAGGHVELCRVRQEQEQNVGSQRVEGVQRDCDDGEDA